jgi:hypothetical protein
MADPDAWPELAYAEWVDTYRTLHLWTQVVGKVRLSLTPWLNHSWQTPLYVTPRGLSTGTVFHDRRPFDLEFDFTDQLLRLRTGDDNAAIPLEPMPVAEFYARVMHALERQRLPVAINTTPNELPDVVPFEQDAAPRAYDGAAAVRFFRALLQADRVFKTFRTGFLGKASPVHFFWGSFDLAVTRFSGRPAPAHPGGVPNLPDTVAREAYSHEVSSAGFWAGGPGCEEAIFYSYAYPEPPGFRDAAVAPAAARFEATLGEFILPYDAVRRAADPDAVLLEFLSATYAAAADNAHWDRAALECGLGRPGKPRLA